MLVRIDIENIALISRITVLFEEGFNVVTGETGAGKSILIQAVSLLMGAPAGVTILKDKKKPAVVNGVFRVPSETIASNSLKEWVDENSEIYLRREVNASGRNKYFLNDRAITRQRFRSVSEYLLNINSQHSNRFLLDEENHLLLLDEAIRAETMLHNVQNAFMELNRLGEIYSKLKRRLEDLLQKKQLYEYQMAEIDAAGLVAGEKEKLVRERERLRYAEEIRSSLSEAWDLCDDTSEFNKISDHIYQHLSKAAQRDPELEEALESWNSVLIHVQDTRETIRRYLDMLEISPEKLESVMSRLHFLQDLEAKYQTDIEGIIEYRGRIAGAVLDLDRLKVDLMKAETDWRAQFDSYLSLCDELSRYRRRKASSLIRKIEKALAEVGMKQARFGIDFLSEQRVDGPTVVGRIPAGFTERGYDRIRFLLSANPGIPLKPLAKIASGGELSRIMLALKQHFDRRSGDQTVVFDEVDTGIGGTVAGAVGVQLKKLSAYCQVVCVTHLPQIAALADNHLMVEKAIGNNRTDVSIRTLSGDERVREIARMLSGHADDETAMAHAEKLLRFKKTAG